MAPRATNNDTPHVIASLMFIVLAGGARCGVIHYVERKDLGEAASIEFYSMYNLSFLASM